MAELSTSDCFQVGYYSFLVDIVDYTLQLCTSQELEPILRGEGLHLQRLASCMGPQCV